MSGQSWTPAPKAGIVPLHPMTFGTVLGRAFAALRHNPKVLFGFAVVVQLVVLVAATVIIAVTFVASFTRLESVPIGSPEYEAILAGTVAWTLVVSLLVALASTAFIAIVQGVVAADVGYAAVGEKANLRMLWRRMRPALWRLLGFSALAIAFGFVLIAVIVGIGFGFAAGFMGSNAALAATGILLAVLAGLAAIPLVIWLATKLMLVPSILVLEGARLVEALRRSWRLIRGRFWFAFGIIVVISLIMGAAAQVVSIPTTLISIMLGGVIDPTGSSSDIGAIIGLVLVLVLPQILILVIQAVGVVVQCTGQVLVYIDCRMRWEGLDQALLSYLERRSQGVSEQLLGDPFAVDPQRAVPAKAPLPQTLSAPPAYFPPAYAPGPYAAAGYPGYAPPPTGAPPYAPAPGYAPPAAPAEPTPPASDSAGRWTAPGSEQR